MVSSHEAYAKLNLFLEVTGKRPDGFHDLESLFLAVSLHDTLTARPAPGGRIGLDAAAPGLPPAADNLVVRAAERLRRAAGITAGIYFRLEKRIPMGAGLGGGSSDAAAALILANRLWGVGMSRAELATLGAELGADVPFFLHGGACLCRGKGEVVEPLPACPAAPPLGLALTSLHSDTAAAYRGLALPAVPRRADAFAAAWTAGDAAVLAELAFNRFEETVFAAFPDLGELWRRLRERGVALRLSGSGSGMWFFGDAAAVARIVAADPDIRELAGRLGLRVMAVTPAPAQEL